MTRTKDLCQLKLCKYQTGENKQDVEERKKEIPSPYNRYNLL
jgi:hypothetical protein